MGVSELLGRILVAARAIWLRAFSRPRAESRREGIVLFDQISNPASVFQYAYFQLAARAAFRADVVSFSNGSLKVVSPVQGRLRAIATTISSNLHYKRLQYRSIGIRQFLEPAPSQSQFRKAEDFVDEQIEAGIDQHKLEQLYFEGILVGDLLYDDYLRYSNKVTIDIRDSHFRAHFVGFVALVLFWQEFFSLNDVRACFGQSIYRTAIPTRISISRGLPTFEGGTRLSSSRIRAFDYSKEFPELFSKMSPENRLAARHYARSILNERQSGLNKRFLRADSPKVYGSEKEQLLASGPAVVIAMHAFTDAPHAYGYGLSPDYWVWLQDLGSVAVQLENLGINWLLKLHPDATPLEEQKARKLALDLGWEVLDKSFGLKNLADRGVRVALTVNGSIATELPLIGIPVIACSRSYPGSRFPFVEVAENYEAVADKLELLLANPPKVLKTGSIPEYFFMRWIYLTASLPYTAHPRLWKQFFANTDYDWLKAGLSWWRNSSVAHDRSILKSLSNRFSSAEGILFDEEGILRILKDDTSK